VHALRRFSVVLAASLAALAMVAVAGAADDDGKVVLTIGNTEDVDNFNPLVGVTVAAYEAWNAHYATLTDKAAADFATEPGLAESWEGSDDGLTYTYTLREGLEWSDGEPLTANDVAFTVNRCREEEWLNCASTVENLTAEAKDDRTVVLTSKVPDPKLPTMDIYILPEHIWGKFDAKAITKYNGLDGVGSGPFVLDEWKKGQFMRMKANPNYYKGKPPIDEVIYRVFNNADAMVAALKKGEIDFAHNVPSGSFDDLQSTDGIVAVQGSQGGFDELALNGGAGLKKPHPALLDPKVREAIMHAIDKQTILDRVYNGLGAIAYPISPGASPQWMPEIPADVKREFDLDQANQILDDAGYEDTNGDGIREMPGGGQPLNLTYMVRSDSQYSAPIAEFVSGWLKEIGIGTTQKPADNNQLTEVIGKGDYDMFTWGWTPFVDPDPMLSYFTCDQVSADPDDPTNYYNDANWCDPEYDKLYQQQKVELDPDKRLEIVHEMLSRFYESDTYNVLNLSPDLQAYRTDRFEGWTRQPTDVGPVLYTNSTPTYANLTPIASSGSDSGGGLSTAGIIGIVVAGIVVIGGGALLLMRRRSADERE
jgi:peptide/nickel transport system substrate-binding protein